MFVLISMVCFRMFCELYRALWLLVIIMVIYHYMDISYNNGNSFVHAFLLSSQIQRTAPSKQLHEL